MNSGSDRDPTEKIQLLQSLNNHKLIFEIRERFQFEGLPPTVANLTAQMQLIAKQSHIPYNDCCWDIVGADENKVIVTVRNMQETGVAQTSKNYEIFLCGEITAPQDSVGLQLLLRRIARKVSAATTYPRP